MEQNFYLPNGSYSILDIQDYFEYILKKKKRKWLVILQLEYM